MKCFQSAFQEVRIDNCYLFRFIYFAHIYKIFSDLGITIDLYSNHRLINHKNRRSYQLNTVLSPIINFVLCTYLLLALAQIFPQAE